MWIFELVYWILPTLILSTKASYSQHEEMLISYYENLIQSEMQRAFLSDLPQSAHRFQPYDSSELQDFGQFDFIIVGAGSAGSVLASRLSEIPSWNVLLIEAGGPETTFSDIPGLHVYLQGLQFNWNYNTTRQRGSCLGMIDRKCSIPRGMVLGGSSTINGLVYCRGNREDFDMWARLGNKGWSYDEVLPYFIKSENSVINREPGYHGVGGYWNVEPHYPISQQITALLQASIALFNFTSADYNGVNQLGMFHTQLNNINGRRHSAAKAFLKPAEHRSNLRILTESYVTRVLLEGKTAYGVEFAKGGRLYYATANKEVILCGGTINSPQLLMLSGIGPARHLWDLGIPLVQDLPVGSYFQDHPCFFGLYIQTNVVEPAYTVREYIRQFLRNYGPYSIALNSQSVGFFQSSYSAVPGHPDFEFQVQPANSSYPFLQRSLKLTDETYQALFSLVDPQSTINMFVILLQPRSVGTLRLKSSDPYEYPLINTNSLTDPEGIDIDIMYQGIQLIETLLQTDPMRRIGATLIYADYEQCRGYPQGSREYWYCAIRIMTAHLYHPMASARMGPSPEHGAVVDHKLRVHGIKGLRVVDVSIFPTPISAHTNAPAIMISEKTADNIKIEYGQRIQPITNY